MPVAVGTSSPGMLARKACTQSFQRLVLQVLASIRSFHQLFFLVLQVLASTQSLIVRGGGLVQCSRYRPNQRIYGSRVLSHYRFFGASVTRERSVISALVVLAHPKPTTECGVWSPVLYATYVKNLLVLVRLVML